MASALLFWSCVAIFCLVGLVGLQLIVVNRVAARRRQREIDCERRWLPVLVGALEPAPASPPAVAVHDLPCLLSLWNRLHDSIKTAPGSALHQFALQIGLDRAARQLLSSPTVTDVLLAVATLGRLRDRRMWPSLANLADGPDPLLSIAAARAMVRIDPAEAVEFLLPIIARRDDWPPPTVVLMLREAGSDVISRPLADAILHAAPEHAHRLIRYLGVASPEVAAPLLRLLIRQVARVESVTACLRVFADADDLGAIRPFLSHPRWEVRVRAVDVVGRLGSSVEAALLIPLLSDREWWVRYRASQALCGLLATDLARVRQLSCTHEDGFARDMLTHVLAERATA